MKKRLFTVLLGLLIMVGSWAESTLIATLTTTATSSVSLKLKAMENSVPIQIDWGNGSLDATVNIATTTLSGIPSGEKVIKIYGDATKLTYLLPYNAKITKSDLSGWSGLQTLDFSSNSSSLAELVLPVNTNNLLSLKVKSATLTRLDISNYTKLSTLVCGGSTKLTELILPSADCALKEVTCTSSGLISIDTHACNNLEKLDISSNNKMTSFILPDNKETFKSLTCSSVVTDGKTLDVSAYANLNYLYCDYCELTSLSIPANPVSGMEIDCSSNYIPMYRLPEVNSTQVYYTPQFCKYVLNESYTTNDVIDLSTAYVRKKGTGYGYNEEGVLPIFAWYTESPKKQLVENEDYTITDGCKFRFSTSVGKSIYCEISNSGYSNLAGQEAYKSTSFSLQEGLFDPIAALTTTATSSVSLKIKAMEDDCPIQIDWGNGIIVSKVVNMATTTISGTPIDEKIIKIYGDASKLIYLSPYNAKITKADLKDWSGLQTLDFSSNSSLLSELTLPTETGSLSSLNVKSAVLTRLDVSLYAKLVTLVCGGSKLTELVLPSADCDLKEITCSNSGITTIDTHAYSNLEKLDISSNNKMTSFILPDNKETFKSLTCTSVVAGSKTLDVSAYVNLDYLYCDYCQLTSLSVPANPVSGIEIDCSSNNIPMYCLPEVNSTKVYYTPQFCKYELEEKYTTNDVIDLSTAYVLKKGVGYDYSAGGAFPTFAWYSESPKKQLVENEDYTVTDGCKFKFNSPVDKSIYCEIAHAGYSNLSGQEAYKSTSFSLEKAPDPIVALTTSNERLIGFSLYATEDNMPIQIDWGNGSLVEKTVNMDKTSIQGTPSGTKVIKIYGDASKLNRITLAYGDYLTDVDLSKCNALNTLEVVECYKIANIIFPENVSTLETLTINNSTIKNLDIHNWSTLKNLTYVPYGASTVVLPDNATALEKISLGKLSLETIELGKYGNLKEIVCNSNTKLTVLSLPSDNLISLEVTSNTSLLSMDVSSCAKLSKLNCRNNAKLASLVLPAQKTILQEFNCARTSLTLDLSGYTNLQVLDCSQIKNVVFPANAGVLTSLTCQETGLTGTLDVSSYVNLKKLDCSYNELTAILVPKNLNNVLDIDCSYNLLRMPNFPEGEKITMSYIFQREKVMTYELKNSYTMDDVIDFSDYYVLKKGIAKSYNAAGVYPTFTWYLEKNNEKLQAGKDYTVTGGCKFQFTKVPDGNVYCAISSKAYPDYTDLNIPYKTTVCFILKGTGVQDINADLAEIFTDNGNIVIAPAEDCIYSVSSLTGQLMSMGEVQDKIEIPVNMSGIYIVRLQAAGRELVRKVVVR